MYTICCHWGLGGKLHWPALTFCVLVLSGQGHKTLHQRWLPRRRTGWIQDRVSFYYTLFHTFWIFRLLTVWIAYWIINIIFLKGDKIITRVSEAHVARHWGQPPANNQLETEAVVLTVQRNWIVPTALWAWIYTLSRSSLQMRPQSLLTPWLQPLEKL